MAEAGKFADESPFPEPATLYDNVYCEPLQEADNIVPLPRRVRAGA